MIVFIVTRKERIDGKDIHSMWPPFMSCQTATDFMQAHIDERLRTGSCYKSVHRQTLFDPSINDRNGVSPRTELSCVIREIELIDKDNRVLYRLIQHPVVEDENMPFALTNKVITITEEDLEVVS